MKKFKNIRPIDKLMIVFGTIGIPISIYHIVNSDKWLIHVICLIIILSGFIMSLIKILKKKIVENKEAVNKFIIIKDLEFSDFMKDENGKIMLFDTVNKASEICGMCEFEDVLICQVVYNHIEND